MNPVNLCWRLDCFNSDASPVKANPVKLDPVKSNNLKLSVKSGSITSRIKPNTANLDDVNLDTVNIASADITQSTIPADNQKLQASPAQTAKTQVAKTMAIVPPQLSYGTAGDHALVQACGQGDQQAFRELYRRHQQKVRSTLFRLCDGADLDDLVQEVFLKAWKGLGGFRQSAQFSTWLYRITVNVATDSRRQLAQKRQRQHHFSTSEHLEDMIDSSVAQNQTNPSLQNLHYQDLVHRAIATLRDEHRFVLVMHDLEDMPQKEIAEILKIPVGTVKSRLFHARGAVRQFLQSQGVEL